MERITYHFIIGYGLMLLSN